MKVLALGCCLLALLALGQAQTNSTNDMTSMPATTAQATAELDPTDMMNTTSVTMTGEPNNTTSVENNSTTPVVSTTTRGGGPGVKASLLFSVLPLVLYAISL